MKLPAEPLTILMLARVIAPSGGIEAALVDLVQALVQSGQRVTVYACLPFEQPNQNVDRLRQTGATLRTCPPWLAAIAAVDEPARLALTQRALRWLTPVLAPLALVDALARRRSFRRSMTGVRGMAIGRVVPRLKVERLYYFPLGLHLRRHRPDIVHVHGWGCGVDPPGALIWAQARGLATVYTEHNSPPEPALGQTPPTWLGLADRIIACSQAGARGLRSVCCADKPISVIPYSVADPVPDGFTAEARPDRPFTFTCLARLNVAQKRQDDLIRAFHLLRAASPALARLLFAGDGPDLQHLQGLVRQLDLSDRVQFLGAVPRERLPWLMAESDVMVLPSTWEGLPVSIIESMAFGKPVIASDAGGNPELVADEQSGLIVPVGGIDQLQQAMWRLMADRELARRMGRAARERFEQGGFRPDTVGATTLAVYRQAMVPQA